MDGGGGGGGFLFRVMGARGFCEGLIFSDIKKFIKQSHMHLIPNGTRQFFIEITAESHTVVRNNTELPCTLGPAAPSRGVLQNYSIIS